MISGANNLKAVASYAKFKETWLTDVLELINGVPSYTTFWTVFVILNPLALEQCFVDWVRSKLKLSPESVVSIDGKAQRGTAKKGNPHSFVHIVSAWAAGHHLTLGQLKVDGKSNEITAIPKLLDMFDIKGIIVTIDAMGCQTDIAENIVKKDADYILALKGNQQSLADEVTNYFNQVKVVNFQYVDVDAICFKEISH